MKYNSDQITHGVMTYANNEVINKLPTIGKWIVGTGLNMASDKVDGLVIALQNNAILKALGVVDESGFFEIENLMRAMKQSAEKYGKAYVEIPVVGKLSFSSADIDTLREYIERA